MSNVVPFPKPPRRARLSRNAWKRLRDRVCAGGVCAGCGRWAGRQNLDAHHVYGRDLGGDDVEQNLAPLCRPCHTAYEDRATGWEPVAAGVRRHVADRHGHALYLVNKLGSSDAARAFLDRYYPERPTREGDDDAA